MLLDFQLCSAVGAASSFRRAELRLSFSRDHGCVPTEFSGGDPSSALLLQQKAHSYRTNYG